MTVTGGISNTGLVAAYGFNEGSGTTVTDSSGSNNTGTITGATWSTGEIWWRPLVQRHVEPGLGERFREPRSELGNDARSVGESRGFGNGLAHRDSQGAARELIYSLYANTDTTRPSGNVFTTAESETRATAALALNTWTHLATTYDGATLRIFVNGVQTNTLAVSGAIKTSTGALRIGGN